MALPVAFYLHHLESGGLERVVLNLLRHLPRERIAPALVLQSRRGALLERVPDDVPVVDLGGKRNLLAARLLAQRLDELGARVAHSGTRWTNYALVRAAGKLDSAPAVLVGEHTPVEAALAEIGHRRLHVAAMRRLYRRAHAVLVPNPAIGDELRAVTGLADLAVRHLPNPVFEAADASGEEEREPDLLVAAGRLVPLKRFDLLLRALALLEAPARLVLLGDGPERAGLERLASELGVSERVSFEGDVTDPYTWYRRAAAVVLTSAREGFPSVLVEAMACGTPVVSVDCPFGPRTLLGASEHGVLVEGETPDAVALGIRSVLADTELAADLSRRGRERVAAHEAATATEAYAACFEEADRLTRRTR